RAWKQELYFHYIVDEAMPIILERTGGKLPMTTGCSLGANHAVITMLRRPDLFSGCLALSGVYDSNVFFKGWMNETLYDNSPECFLPNMSPDHPYIDEYNQKQIIICVGQGAWEEDGVRSLRYLDSVFREKGIGAWCDFWGYDVNHDWPWWFKQMRYFIPIILERWGMQ
ncbi:MAG: alpha/beta hydrolase-fold protein, partial [Lachnospiraceae bacterium]|nr:alpha/beta hydrolase-fold protein [Lachnospiraceae bacterium]